VAERLSGRVGQVRTIDLKGDGELGCAGTTRDRVLVLGHSRRRIQPTGRGEGKNNHHPPEDFSDEHLWILLLVMHTFFGKA
jgi:hypothetical protein